MQCLCTISLDVILCSNRATSKNFINGPASNSNSQSISINHLDYLIPLSNDLLKRASTLKTLLLSLSNLNVYPICISHLLPNQYNDTNYESENYNVSLSTKLPFECHSYIYNRLVSPLDDISKRTFNLKITLFSPPNLYIHVCCTPR
jgi:hypothetical protein